MIEPHIQALIFDLDGTLADTMPGHYLAWRDTIRANGGDFPEDVFYGTAGMPSNRIIEMLNLKYGYQLDPEQIAQDKETLFYQKYLPQIKPIEAVVAIARRYKGELPIAIATGGISRIVDQVLKILELDNFFDAIVTSEDVKNGKPAPDTFLEAARRLNVLPQFCHVFEDSDLGIKAAHLAGMTATDVRPWYTTEK